MQVEALSSAGTGLSGHERRAAMALSGLYALRILGLFMILPVLALYTGQLDGATPLLTGLAIGIYGLTQASLQIPFGLLSDRYGRKRIIILGLTIYAIGSVLAALADGILGVIVGRALQGAGAIAAVIMALASDLSREQQRTRMMAIIGLAISLAFALAMVLGPVLASQIGVRGIFWLIAALATTGILVTLYVVPIPPPQSPRSASVPVRTLFRQVLSDTRLLRLNFGIFMLHGVLTATFLVLPLALRDQAGFAADRHWQLFFIAALLAIPAMLPLLRLAERRPCLKAMLLWAILALGLIELGLWYWHGTVWQIGWLLFAFFTVFNLLEALLPALLSRLAPVAARGVAMGVYASSQFFGAFVGGVGGGWMYGVAGLEGVFALAAGGALLWIGVAWTLPRAGRLSPYRLPVPVMSEQEAAQVVERLRQVPGVVAAVVHATQGVAHLVVDHYALDRLALRELAQRPA